MALSDMPVGAIILWGNTAIPTNWAICDGVHASVPDMVGKLVMGAAIDADRRVTGGTTTHKHTTPNTSTRGIHNHGGSASTSVNNGGGGTKTTSGSGVTFGQAGSHTHGSGSISISSEDSHSHTLSDTGYTNHVPARVKRVFIRKVT